MIKKRNYFLRFSLFNETKKKEKTKKGDSLDFFGCEKREVEIFSFFFVAIKHIH